MIRILHMVGAMYPGGLENFIMNLYEDIDREQFQFDFVVHLRKEGDYVEQIEAMGGQVYVLPRLTANPIKSLWQLFQLVRKNQYPIVIRHTANALISPQLLMARLAGAKTICHSHNETDPQQTLHRLGKLLLPFVTTERMACSPKAGQWMYGKRSFTEIHNAIHIDKFAYSLEKSIGIKQEFDTVLRTNRDADKQTDNALKNENKNHIYGHIANFIASKNHMFLLEVFAEIKKLDPDAIFFCLGEGELRPQIEAKRKELGLEGCVVLTGIRKDVENFMSAMDVLVFPSFFEGLPLTLIEAQTAGLPMVISDTITREVEVTEGLIHWESLQASPREWAQKAVALAKHQDDLQRSALQNTAAYRPCQEENITKAGYNMKTLVKFYEAYFNKLAKK